MRPSSRAVVRRAQRRARAEAAGRRATLSPASKPQDVASRSRPCRTAPAPPPHHGCAEPAEPARATRSGSDPSSPRGTLMRSNVSRETIWCLRTDVSRETFGSFAVSSGSPRAARSRCPLFRGMRGRDSRAEREARGTGRQSAGRAGLAGGARGARGGRASRRVRREWARFSIGLTTGWQAGWQRLHAMHDYLGPSSKAQEENPGRKKRRWRRIVHSVQSLPCGDVRRRRERGRGRPPAEPMPPRAPPCTPLRRARLFHVKQSGA